VQSRVPRTLFDLPAVGQALETPRFEGEVGDEVEGVKEALLGTAALILGIVLRIVAAWSDKRCVVVVGMGVLPIRSGQLHTKFAEIDADGKIGPFQGVVEVAAVDEDADSIHER